MTDISHDSFSISDLLEIQRLAAEFNLRFDEGDPDRFNELFAPDGVLVSRTGGVTAADRSEKVLDSRSRPPHRHFTTNHVIDPDPQNSSQARGLACWIYVELVDGNVRTNSVGTYTDEYVKHDGRWLFKSREAVAEKL
jgi:hypothetical protein